MGMYDLINGEQVKCFPWVSLYKNEISYHGGDLKNYKTGDEVPYKRPHYNYEKNFVILDINRYPENNDFSYNYFIHVIADGKVKDTFKNNVGEINWPVNKTVVGYSGELLNIHSNEDVVDYIAAQRKYWKDFENVRGHWNVLFKESVQYFVGIGLLDKESEEKKMRLNKIEEIRRLMDEEETKIQPKLDDLIAAHSKWFVDTSGIADLINLGDYISAYNTRTDEKEQCKDMVQKLLDSDSDLYNRYVAWQGTDEYIEEVVNYSAIELPRIPS